MTKLVSRPMTITLALATALALVAALVAPLPWHEAKAAEGDFLLSFPTGSSVTWNNPGMAADGNDNVYISSRKGTAKTVEKYSPSGAHLLSIDLTQGGGLGFVSSIDIHGGFLYANDINIDVVKKFDINSGLLDTSWPGTTYGGEVAVDPTTGNLWLSDSIAGTYTEYSNTGTLLNTHTFTPGCGAGQLNLGEHFVFDSQGNLYQNDTNCGKVVKLNNSGTELLRWGNTGTGPGEFRGIMYIAVDKTRDIIYVGDRNLSGPISSVDLEIHAFQSDGSYLGSLGFGDLHQGVLQGGGFEVNSIPQVYVGTDVPLEVRVYEGYELPPPPPPPACGDFLDEWLMPDAATLLVSPTGVGTDSSGNVYVTAAGENKVYKFDNNGNLLASWGGTGDGLGQFRFPSDIAVDSAGNTYVSNQQNTFARIQKFDSSMNEVLRWGSQGSGNGQFISGRSLALNPAQDRLYLTDKVNSRVVVFNPANGDFLFNFGVGTLDNPVGIAVDSLGYVYVTAWVGPAWIHQISKFDADGNFVTSWGDYGTGDGQVKDTLGIAVDANDLVYVVDFDLFGSKRVQVFTSTGSFVDKFTIISPNIPIDIAIGSGNAFITHKNGEKIQKYAAGNACLPPPPLPDEVLAVCGDISAQLSQEQIDEMNAASDAGDIVVIPAGGEVNDSINLSSPKFLIVGEGAFINGNIYGDGNVPMILGANSEVNGNIEGADPFYICGSGVSITGNSENDIGELIVLEDAALDINGNVNDQGTEVRSGGSLISDGNMTVNGDLTLESGSLLVVSGNIDCSGGTVTQDGTVFVHGNNNCTGLVAREGFGGGMNLALYLPLVVLAALGFVIYVRPRKKAVA